MNPYRILGAAANLFFIVFFSIFLSIEAGDSQYFSFPVILSGSVILYTIAVLGMIVCFGVESERFRRNGLYGSVVSMLTFSYFSLAEVAPQAQQGMMLLTVWSVINVLALGFGDETTSVSYKEKRRLAEQKRKLDRLRGNNPNESDKPAS